MKRLFNILTFAVLVTAGMAVVVVTSRYAESISYELKLISWLSTGALIGAGVGVPFRHPLRGAAIGLVIQCAFLFFVPRVA